LIAYVKEINEPKIKLIVLPTIDENKAIE